MNKLHVIASSRREAQFACDVLEDQGFLDPTCRDLRPQEVAYISSRDGDALRGLSLRADEIVLVDGWDREQIGWEVARELTMLLARHGESLNECARVTL